ncbi:protein phosphatase inhibitor 2 isoform X2 [Lacerta agilis]|uniref:protein phosphatase inhibitor 2 isoform X2 n=1 Tax=Lacerta agilis TaxID=80427 RepID=UPI0014198127|nr:protein phosphatase inhibitor 2 isoform X2 [Lacerta agilis]
MTPASRVACLLRVRRARRRRDFQRPPVPPPAPEEKQLKSSEPGERGGSEATGGRASGRAGSASPPPGAMEAKSSSSSGRPPVKGILKNPSGGSGSGGAGLVAAALAEASSTAAKAKPAAAKPAAAEAPLGGGTYDGDAQGKKSQKWDEMNILATYHPAGKDYGLMKIDEPSTPYHSMAGEDEDAGSDTECNEAVTADVLAKKLAAAEHGKGPKILAQQEESSDEEDDESELTPEEREKKRQFEMKRKIHYNEGKNIKLARQLIAKELHGDAANEEEDDDECDDEDEGDECDEEMRDTVDLDWDC